MRALVKPPRLVPGDKVATVSLSWGGPGTFPWKYEAGVRQLEDFLSVNVVPSRHAMKDAQWLKDNPQARADDLMECFLDPSIKAIFSTIGGSDSIRLLPYIDLNIIKNNPKIFVGYSDTTVSHFACYQAGVSSFYGPSIMAGFGENGGLFPYMADAVRRILMEPVAYGLWKPNADGWQYEQKPWEDKENQAEPRALFEATRPQYLQGKEIVEGRLLGGCMEVLEFLKGTSYWPKTEEWDDGVLFLETSEEGPSPEIVLRWLRNYAAQGIIHRVKAILFGRPGGVTLDKFLAYDDMILHFIRDECALPSLPVVTMLDFGHTDPMFVLPYGMKVKIDPQAQRIYFEEAAVE